MYPPAALPLSVRVPNSRSGQTARSNSRTVPRHETRVPRHGTHNPKAWESHSKAWKSHFQGMEITFPRRGNHISKAWKLQFQGVKIFREREDAGKQRGNAAARGKVGGGQFSGFRPTGNPQGDVCGLKETLPKLSAESGLCRRASYSHERPAGCP